jgi:hypothetical protein
MFPESQRMTEVECLRCGRITTFVATVTRADGSPRAPENLPGSELTRLPDRDGRAKALSSSTPATWPAPRRGIGSRIGRLRSLLRGDRSALPVDVET